MTNDLNIETNDVMTQYPFLKEHHNKTFYVYFECDYLEDDQHLEYTCKFISQDIDILTNEIAKNKQGGCFSYYNCIDKFIVKFESSTDKIFWNKKYNSWTDIGCFKTISISDFQTKLIM